MAADSTVLTCVTPAMITAWRSAHCCSTAASRGSDCASVLTSRFSEGGSPADTSDIRSA